MRVDLASVFLGVVCAALGVIGGAAAVAIILTVR